MGKKNKQTNKEKKTTQKTQHFQYIAHKPDCKGIESIFQCEAVLKNTFKERF